MGFSVCLKHTYPTVSNIPVQSQLSLLNEGSRRPNSVGSRLLAIAGSLLYEGFRGMLGMLLRSQYSAYICNDSYTLRVGINDAHSNTKSVISALQRFPEGMGVHVAYNLV